MWKTFRVWFSPDPFPFFFPFCIDFFFFFLTLTYLTYPYLTYLYLTYPYLTYTYLTWAVIRSNDGRTLAVLWLYIDYPGEKTPYFLLKPVFFIQKQKKTKPPG